MTESSPFLVVITRPSDAYPVASIEVVERGEGIIAQARFGHEQLDLAGRIAQVGEGQPPLLPLEHQAPGYPDSGRGLLARRELAELVTYRPQVVVAIEPIRIGSDARLAKSRNFLES